MPFMLSPNSTTYAAQLGALLPHRFTTDHYRSETISREYGTHWGYGLYSYIPPGLEANELYLPDKFQIEFQPEVFCNMRITRLDGTQFEFILIERSLNTSFDVPQQDQFPREIYHLENTHGLGYLLYPIPTKTTTDLLSKDLVFKYQQKIIYYLGILDIHTIRNYIQNKYLPNFAEEELGRDKITEYFNTVIAWRKHIAAQPPTYGTSSFMLGVIPWEFPCLRNYQMHPEFLPKNLKVKFYSSKALSPSKKTATFVLSSIEKASKLVAIPFDIYFQDYPLDPMILAKKAACVHFSTDRVYLGEKVINPDISIDLYQEFNNYERKGNESPF